MSERTTFVSFLLDETGSMGSIREDTVAGLNQYVDTLRESGSDIVFSLVSFNSNRTRRRWVAEPIAEVAPLALEEYRPDAMTPLIDATVKIIEATDEAVALRQDDPRVVVVIQTDGEENVSVEYDSRHLASLVKEKTAAGWEFVFLGAGLDAFGAARRAGIHLTEGRVASYQRGRSAPMFASMAMNTREYAESGDAGALDFGSEQRRAFGDSGPERKGHRTKRSSARSGTKRSPTVEPMDLTRPSGGGG